MLKRFVVSVFQPASPSAYLTVQAATWEDAYDRIQKQINNGTLVVSADGDLGLDPETEILDVYEDDA